MPRLLLCVRDSEMANVLQVALSKLDAVPETLGTAAEALSAARRGPPDALIEVAAPEDPVGARARSLRRVPGCEHLAICEIGPPELHGHHATPQARR